MKNSGSTPMLVKIVGGVFVVAILGAAVLSPMLFAHDQAKKAATIPDSTPERAAPAPQSAEALPPVAESAPALQVASAPEAVTPPEPAVVETPPAEGKAKEEYRCPNDACTMLPDELMKDARERQCSRIVIRPPTPILNGSERIALARLVYGRLVCRTDMTFDWPGETATIADETLYVQELEGRKIYFRFGSW